MPNEDLAVAGRQTIVVCNSQKTGFKHSILSSLKKRNGTTRAQITMAPLMDLGWDRCHLLVLSCPGLDPDCAVSRKCPHSDG